jgi:hypothetical protein
MRLVIKILFFVFLATRLYGQSKTDELFSTIEQIKSLAKLTDQQDKFRLLKRHNDSLNLDIIQTNWTIKKGKKETSIKLLTLSLGDKIFYHEFYQQRLNDDFESWSNKKLHVAADSSLLKNLNKRQNLKYKSDIDFDQLTRLPYRGIFGYACYEAGTMPHDGLLMGELVNKGETKELEKWLVSISPVRQAYAYLGLKLLQSRGTITLIDDTVRIMHELETSSQRVYSCSGCTFWDYVPMNEQLTTDKVDSFTKRTKKTK